MGSTAADRQPAAQHALPQQVRAAAQLLRARLAPARASAFAGVVFASPVVAGVGFAVGRVLGAAREGVSLYLEAFAVASTVSGLIRFAAPRSLRNRCRPRRIRSFWLTPPLVAAALSHFASSSANPNRSRREDRLGGH